MIWSVRTYSLWCRWSPWHVSQSDARYSGYERYASWKYRCAPRQKPPARQSIPSCASDRRAPGSLARYQGRRRSADPRAAGSPCIHGSSPFSNRTVDRDPRRVQRGRWGRCTPVHALQLAPVVQRQRRGVWQISEASSFLESREDGSGGCAPNSLEARSSAYAVKWCGPARSLAHGQGKRNARLTHEVRDTTPRWPRAEELHHVPRRRCGRQSPPGFARGRSAFGSSRHRSPRWTKRVPKTRDRARSWMNRVGRECAYCAAGLPSWAEDSPEQKASSGGGLW
jgi:hypothetical protein